MVGYAAAPKPARTVLPAPSATNPVAGRQNQEGIQAYDKKEWVSAKRHFETAIETSPTVAEAHYNLGMVICRLGALREGDMPIIKAVDLARGTKLFGIYRR